MKEYVNLINNNGIGIIEFFHEQSNSLPSNILNELAEKISQAGNDENINIIILQSGGDRVFCAGASFDELSSIENEEQGRLFFSGFANVINSARKCPKLIIGRVHGKAVGGGVGIAASTDYCFGTKHSLIKLSELSIGIGPFVVAPPIERKIGLSSFSQLAINATKWHSAEWAKQKGLFAEVYASTKEMDAAILILSKELSLCNPESMLSLKKIMWEGTDNWDTLLLERASISGKRVLSDFTRKTLSQLKNG